MLVSVLVRLGAQSELILSLDSASPDDPNEISFAKGEIMDIMDKQGKWWQAKKADGSIGSTFIVLDVFLYIPDLEPSIVAPSNYLQII